MLSLKGAVIFAWPTEVGGGGGVQLQYGCHEKAREH